MDRPRVLFLCAHNAARSQMAETLLRRLAGDRFDVSSAGLRPTEVHPLTRQVLQEVGIDTTGLQAEGLEMYLAKVSVRHAVVVCAITQAECPRLYPFAQQTLYWPFEDPVPSKARPRRSSRSSVKCETRSRIGCGLGWRS